MADQNAIETTARPATASSLAADLRSLGLDSGMTVMVHSSLSNLGYVSGGAHAVVMALRQVLGDTGTLVMPTHSSDLTDPGSWSNPPVPESWWDEIRSEMPAYDPLLTPTRLMGAIVECFRHVSGVVRSEHPTVSAAAVGPNAEFIVSNHELAHGLGESSPRPSSTNSTGRSCCLAPHTPTTRRCTWPSTGLQCLGPRYWSSHRP